MSCCYLSIYYYLFIYLFTYSIGFSLTFVRKSRNLQGLRAKNKGLRLQDIASNELTTNLKCLSTSVYLRSMWQWESTWQTAHMLAAVSTGLLTHTFNDFLHFDDSNLYWFPKHVHTHTVTSNCKWLLPLKQTFENVWQEDVIVTVVGRGMTRIRGMTLENAIRCNKYYNGLDKALDETYDGSSRVIYCKQQIYALLTASL